MIENYVTFEQAKLLKENGFPQNIDEDFPDRTLIVLSDEPNNIIDYNSASIQGFLDNDYLSEHSIKWYVVPTLSFCRDWIYEKYDIFLEVVPTVDVEGTFKGFHCEMYSKVHTDFIWDTLDICKESPKEALSEGISKVLELCIKQAVK